MPVRKSLNHIPPSPVKMVEDEAAMKQGIVTILGSDCGTSKAGSIRRTLSADMSSKRWLQQSGFLSPIKKIVSSETLLLPPPSHSSSSSSEDECEEIANQDDVWRKIQAQKERDSMHKPAQIQVWGSIITQKSENSLLPPPYVHPLVKRSTSTLSEKSLEVCTESLGSETGSDCLSSRSCSEILGDGDEEREERQKVVTEELKDSDPFADLLVAKYKKSPAMPFPPPLPSIAGSDGTALHMHSHRENGRLVLEAVSVPPRNYFHAQREDGRLVLSLLHAPATSSPTGNEGEEYEKVFDDMEEVGDDVQEEEEDAEAGADAAYGGSSDDDVEEEDAEAEKSVEKESEFMMPSGMIRVHKTGLMMKKLMAVGNINPTWSEKSEAGVAIPQSLPSPPMVGTLMPPAAAVSFNPYEYFWRNKATVSGGFINPMTNNKNPNRINGVKGCENQDSVLMKRNKTEQFVPNLRGCKEARGTRRSLLIWEPYCIATS